MTFDKEKKYYVYAWFYKQSGKIFYIGKGTKKNNFQNRTNISTNLAGRSKSAYGYVWKYKQDNTEPSLQK